MSTKYIFDKLAILGSWSTSWLSAFGHYWATKSPTYKLKSGNMIRMSWSVDM